MKNICDNGKRLIIVEKRFAIIMRMTMINENVNDTK